MGFSRTSYAEIVNSAKVLKEGINNNLSDLSAVGMQDLNVTEMENQKKLVEDLNVKQERLKAELKTTTGELEKELKKLSRLISRGKKLVKIEIPQSKWKEFGIEDKQ